MWRLSACSHVSSNTTERQLQRPAQLRRKGGKGDNDRNRVSVCNFSDYRVETSLLSLVPWSLVEGLLAGLALLHLTVEMSAHAIHARSATKRPKA